MFAILIATKNRKDDLLLTLQKLESLLQREDVSCTVYDDGSTDGTARAIQQHFPQIQLLRNETSKGYIYCRNQMLNTTIAPFAISLDDDAHFLSENPLQEIRQYFESNPHCGLIAFRIFWNKELPENPRTIESAQRTKAFVGCGHVWRMEAWHEIPDYPEWFEFYGEEEFAALQLFKKNLEVHYLPQVLVLHRVNLKLRTQKQKDFGFRYQKSLRAGWYVFLLFYPLSKIPGIFGYSLWMQFRKIIKGNFKIALPLLKAMADIVLNIQKVKANRNPLTLTEYENYRQLKETKIYWTPEK